jgi:hypothetical protein
MTYNYNYPLYAPWWKVELGKLTEQEKQLMKKTKKNSKGDTFEWEETTETIEALKKLHADRISRLENEAPDYGVGK